MLRRTSLMQISYKIVNFKQVHASLREFKLAPASHNLSLQVGALLNFVIYLFTNLILTEFDWMYFIGNALYQDCIIPQLNLGSTLFHFFLQTIIFFRINFRIILYMIFKFNSILNCSEQYFDVSWYMIIGLVKSHVPYV